MFKKIMHYLFGFNVHVNWAGTKVIHAAKNAHDAIDWMYQYPSDAKIQITAAYSNAVLLSRGF